VLTPPAVTPLTDCSVWDVQSDTLYGTLLYVHVCMCVFPCGSVGVCADGGRTNIRPQANTHTHVFTRCSLSLLLSRSHLRSEPPQVSTAIGTHLEGQAPRSQPAPLHTQTHRHTHLCSQTPIHILKPQSLPHHLSRYVSLFSLSSTTKCFSVI
jgi:hypothetical protein